MANTSDIRKGLCLEYNHDIFVVIEFMHVKPGKGNAFVRTKLKSLTTGRVLDNTFSAGHKIDAVRVERRKFQFLYSDDDAFHFMNNETYEQVQLAEAMLSAPGLLKEGESVEMLYHAEKEIPLTVEMDQYVELQITYTEPGVRGDTATNASKPATVETGAEIRVPLFINEGDVVKVRTEDSAYVERVKK
jgi:elongation factor P